MQVKGYGIPQLVVEKKAPVEEQEFPIEVCLSIKNRGSKTLVESSLLIKQKGKVFTCEDCKGNFGSVKEVVQNVVQAIAEDIID